MMLPKSNMALLEAEIRTRVYRLTLAAYYHFLLYLLTTTAVLFLSELRYTTCFWGKHAGDAKHDRQAQARQPDPE